MSAARASEPHHRSARTGRIIRRLIRFAGVGGAGFVVDASVLTLLVNGFSYGHYTARAVSFASAVTVTWYANRRWVFGSGSPRRDEYLGYFVVQAIGAAINLGIYAAIIEAVPPLGAIPVVPLMIGAAIALIFNYSAAARFVFKLPEVSS